MERQIITDLDSYLNKDGIIESQTFENCDFDLKFVGIICGLYTQLHNVTYISANIIFLEESFISKAGLYLFKDCIFINCTFKDASLIFPKEYRTNFKFNTEQEDPKYKHFRLSQENPYIGNNGKNYQKFN